jgi:hypothetical protein
VFTQSDRTLPTCRTIGRTTARNLGLNASKISAMAAFTATLRLALRRQTLCGPSRGNKTFKPLPCKWRRTALTCANGSPAPPPAHAQSKAHQGSAAPALRVVSVQTEAPYRGCIGRMFLFGGPICRPRKSRLVEMKS